MKTSNLLSNSLKIALLTLLSFNIFGQNSKITLAQALQELNQKRGIFFTFDEIGRASCRERVLMPV